MVHLKNKLMISLTLAMVVAATTACARTENTNPLTGQVVGQAVAESDAALKQRRGRGDPVAGKDKSLLCQGCHGEQGISMDGLIPSLAGQYGPYITKELRNYQAGTRSHQIMNAMAAKLGIRPSMLIPCSPWQP